MNEFELENLYFKDAFDLSSDGINISVNNVETNCITSSFNNFHLDSEGNLVVKTINATDGDLFEINYQQILNMVYPIGSIYMSVNSANPSILFGGNWTQWGQGKVPVGIDTTQIEFNTSEKTGGSKTHNHTCPNHKHKVDNLYGMIGFWTNAISANRISTSNWNDNVYFDNVGQRKTSNDSNSYGIKIGGETNNEGGGNTGVNTNLQPYITCYMWKRLS